METEYDEYVLEYWKLPNGNFIVKFKKDDGLDGDKDVKNTLPSHLGAFILSKVNEIRIILSEISTVFIKIVYTMETRIVCI